MKRINLIVVVGLFCAYGQAQNNSAEPLDLLATQCRQVIELAKEVNDKETKLASLNAQLDKLKSDWYSTCQEVLSNPNCTVDDIDNLINLTDIRFEEELLAELEAVRKNPGVSTLKPQQSGSVKKTQPKNDNKGSEDQNQKEANLSDVTKDNEVAPTEPKGVDSKNNNTKDEAEPIVSDSNTKEFVKKEDTPVEVPLKNFPAEKKNNINSKVEPEKKDDKSNREQNQIKAIMEDKKNKNGNTNL